MRLKNTLLIGILMLAALACAAAEEDCLRLTLSPERAPVAGEDLWLEVHAGALPAKASLEIRDAAGGKIGAVAPFGQVSRTSGSSYRIPLPAELQRGDPFELRVQLLAESGARRPTADELREIRLVFVPVSE